MDRKYTSALVPFDGKLLTKRLSIKKANRNDLLNREEITFSSNQLTYFEQKGQIPKEFFDQIDTVLSDPDFSGKKVQYSIRYGGNLLYFGPSEFIDFKKRCKNAKLSLTELLNYEHVSPSTFSKYRKDRHVPSELLEKLCTRLSMIEKSSVKNSEEPKKEVKVEAETPIKVEAKVEPKKVESNFGKVVQSIKKVVRCNGEANLNLNNIPERYDCDVETFVNSVFSLVSSENYVIFTTYNNGKPVFTLSEPM